LIELNSWLDTEPQDPYNGMTWMDAMDSMFGPGGVYGSNPNGSGGGRSGGGGGGGGGSGRPGDPDPLGWNSIAQSQAVSSGYQAMLDALAKQQAAVMGGFDTRQSGMAAANQASIDRMNQLMGELNTNAAATRQNVAGSYAQADQSLEGLMNQYAGMVQSRQPQVSQTIQAFGGDPAQAFGDPRGVQDMLTAQRANLMRVGQADDALFANRSNVYNGLNADVSTQRQQMFDQLMAKLLADRQQADAQGAQAQAQMAMQQQQAMLQLAQQEQARRAQYV
jgi:hypothetical protein